MTATPQVFIDDVAKRVVLFRKAAGLSQYELARRLEIHRSQLSQYENAKGPIPLYTLYLIAQELGVSIDKLTSNKPIKVQSLYKEGYLAGIARMMRLGEKLAAKIQEESTNDTTSTNGNAGTS